MASLELRKLWQLHLVDSALQDMRARAAALDPGRRLMGEIKALSDDFEAKNGLAAKLHGEMTDLELNQKSIDQKLKKIDADLYGGKVVNPREVENLQKEIGILKKQRDESDERLLELMESEPPARSEADKVQAVINEKKRELAEHQAKVMVEKSRLEAAYKEQMGMRPAVLKEVSPVLLGRYEQIVKNHGTGMAQITKQNTCSACGLSLAERVLQLVKDDRVTPCEQCHRILYYTEGVV